VGLAAIHLERDAADRTASGILLHTAGGQGRAGARHRACCEGKGKPHVEETKDNGQEGRAHLMIDENGHARVTPSSIQ
jgi:hypothetical protein